jgi:hypothetical protein
MNWIGPSPVRGAMFIAHEHQTSWFQLRRSGMCVHRRLESSWFPMPLLAELGLLWCIGYKHSAPTELLGHRWPKFTQELHRCANGYRERLFQHHQIAVLGDQVSGNGLGRRRPWPLTGCLLYRPLPQRVNNTANLTGFCRKDQRKSDGSPIAA